MDSPRQQCATLFGASLTAAALVLSALSFLHSSQSSSQNTLLSMISPVLKNVCISFLTSSLLFITSLIMSFGLEAIQQGSEDAQNAVRNGLTIVMGLGFALLFIGISQLLVILQMSWEGTL